MADRVRAEGFRTWRQQRDLRNELSQFRPSLPKFVLQKFCSDRARGGSHQIYSWQADTGDDFITAYDIKGRAIEGTRWQEIFETADTYQERVEKLAEDTFARDKPEVPDKFQNVNERIFGGLEGSLWHIYELESNGDSTLSLSRREVNALHKFLFLASSIRNQGDIQYLVNNDERMVEAKKKRMVFMGGRNLSRERDLWLSNTLQILRNHHYGVPSQPEISELDRDDYRANAHERFAVFWKPAEEGDEFILTDNSFWCFEGGNLGADVESMDASEQARHLYTKDYMWHRLYVVSPTLVVALCHGSLIDKELTNQHRNRYGLGRSLLENLPHIHPENYYKDMTRDECRFLDNDWNLPPEFANGFSGRVYDGKSAMAEDVETLCYPVLPLESSHVAKVNAVLLQSRDTLSTLKSIKSICIRPSAKQCLLRALVVFEEIDWAENSTVPQRKDYSTLKSQLQRRVRLGGDFGAAGSMSMSTSAQPQSPSSEDVITTESPFRRLPNSPSSPSFKRVPQAELSPRRVGNLPHSRGKRAGIAKLLMPFGERVYGRKSSLTTRNSDYPTIFPTSPELNSQCAVSQTSSGKNRTTPSEQEHLGDSENVRGVSPNAATPNCDQMSLQAASRGGHLEVVKSLLAAGADVNAAAPKYGPTALQAASEHGHLEIVKSLLAAGADANTTIPMYVRTALQAASGRGDLDIVKSLLAAGADVNAAAPKYGQTALQAASWRGHLDIVKSLLVAGAD
ncbi:MAG: hypothetical protein M1813_001567, partial [Trichoglossum hirsutum]